MFYEKPTIEVEKIVEADIITASGSSSSREPLPQGGHGTQPELGEGWDTIF